MRSYITGIKIICLLIIALHGNKLQAQGSNYIKGLKGTDSLPIQKVWRASLFVPGYAQAYNKQYWKIPVIYGSAAAMIYGGSKSHSMYQQTGMDKYLTQSRLYYAGAGLMYISSVLDGVSSYKVDKKIYPFKATAYSLFVPGLGQAYSGYYWKVPIIYGGFAFWYYWYDLNQTQYKRYRTAYNQEDAFLKGDSTTPSEFTGRELRSIGRERDRYVRQRNYAILYGVLWHLVNVVDASVFAHLSDFDVSNDLALRISPTMMPENIMYGEAPAVGLTFRLSLK